MAIFPSEETAYDALNAAHWISCYPFVFQSVICLLRGGVLAYLDETPNGASFDQIGQKTGLSQGALKVLLQAAVYFDILNLRDGLYSNTKTAHFLLTDKIVKANLDFAQDVCYLGLFNLLESLKEEKPIGLETLGQAETIYPILSTLNEPARTSWYTFDHCYSDKCFSKALDILLSSRPSTICDIGFLKLHAAKETPNFVLWSWIFLSNAQLSGAICLIKGSLIVSIASRSIFLVMHLSHRLVQMPGG